jgi:hypothetical protein
MSQIAPWAQCSAPTNTAYGMKEIIVTTLDGHRIVLGQDNPVQKSCRPCETFHTVCLIFARTGAQPVTAEHLSPPPRDQRGGL